MKNEKLLFVNFYSSLNIPNYKKYILPGKNEGVNGSVFGGFNIGINKYIDEEKLKPALEVIKYLTSEKFQKEIIIKQSKLFSGLSKLYDDEECCQYVNCDVMKETQFFHRPSSTMENYEYFSGKAVKFFQDFLNGHISVKEVLKDIENIININYFNINSTVGAIVMAIIIILFVIIALSLILIFTPKYRKDYYNFLPLDFWLIYTLGSVIMLVTNILIYNEQNAVKCTIRYILMALGNACIFIPILYKLLISFPKINQFSEWLRKNRFIYVFTFVIIHSLLSTIISVIGTFKIKDINFKNDDLNFQICDFDNRIGKILYLFQCILNLILYLVIGFLIFLEWNLTEIFLYLRHIAFVMIIDGITLTLYIVMNSVDINDYILYGLIHISINLLFVFMNHIYLIVIRVLFSIKTKGKSYDEKKENNIMKNKYFAQGLGVNNETFADSNNNKTFISTSSRTTYIYEVSKSSYSSKLISYHYSTAPTK